VALRPMQLEQSQWWTMQVLKSGATLNIYLHKSTVSITLTVKDVHLAIDMYDDEAVTFYHLLQRKLTQKGLFDDTPDDRY
jgi:hypothetical protein